MSKCVGMTIAPAVTGRFQSLEGRPLGMSSSVMLPESARLRLLELGSSFATALAEQRQPMTGLLIPQPRRPLVGGPSGVSKAPCGWYRATTMRRRCFITCTHG
jgi:hypothetical protein